MLPPSKVPLVAEPLDFELRPKTNQVVGFVCFHWSMLMAMGNATNKPEAGYAKGRAKRLKIVEAATTLFGEVGYRSASLRQVAARCDLSHPGLLHHFPTKEALLQAVLEQRDHDDAAFLHDESATALQGLRQLPRLVDQNSERREVIDLFVSLAAEATSPDHPAHDYFVRRYQNSLKKALRAYKIARAEGILHIQVDPHTAAQQLIALMDGLQIQWLLDGGATDMAGAVRAHLQLQLTVDL